MYSPPGWSAPNGEFAPMPQNFPPGYVPEGGAGALAGGVPWEQKGGSMMSKWWATVKAVNNETRPFFAAASQNEKGDAIFFAMVSGGVSGAFIGLLYMVIFTVVGAGMFMAFSGRHASGSSGMGSGAFAAGFTVGIAIVYAVVITASSAIGAAGRAFIWGGLHHVLLMLFGGIGERKSFMHTVRAAAYAEGAALPWIWIPVAGPFIAAFYGIRNTIVGYDETHKCGMGRAALVLFAPALCCCACMAFAMLLGGLPALFKP